MASASKTMAWDSAWEEAFTRGNGLHNIALRARQLGARLDIRLQPWPGTRRS
jgi:signal transduction histidine kinase